MKTICVKDVKIPVEFLLSMPGQKKIDAKIKRYRSRGKFKPIVLNEDGILTDGYATLLAANQVNPEMQIEYIIKDKYKNTETIYVFGKHPNPVCDKQYVWRMPSSANYIPQPGETVLAKTKFGIAPVIVDETKVLNKPPYDGVIKIVTKWNLPKEE